MVLSLIAEATEYDFKRELERDKPISWLKSVSAFANGIGGTLIFGVDDDTKIIGLTDTQADADFISNRIKERITPIPEFILTPYRDNGKDILALVVKAGRNAPYYYSPDAGIRKPYIRIGSESVPAPDHIVHELILKGTNQTFDAIGTEYKKDDYSFTLLEATYRHRTRLRFESTDYVSFGLATDDGMLTRAGSLLADQRIVFNARVFCTRWRGLEMGSLEDDAIDDKEYEGNLIQLLQDSCNFVKLHNQVRFEKAPMERIDKPDYAERAVLEAVVNSLIHRDWLVQGAEVHINIYDDRCEISSPGGMFNGRPIQNQNIYAMESERRNPVIADLFHRMKYMDRRGSGLRKIVNETKKIHGYEDKFEPTFHSTHSSFRVVLKNVNYKGEEDASVNKEIYSQKDFGLNFGINFGLNEMLTSVLKIIIANPNVKAQAIADELGVTRRSIEFHISKLKDAGLIEREGAKKTGRWIVKNL